MSVKDQITTLLERYPSLSMVSDKGGYTLTGVLTLDKSYNDIPLYDDYHVRIFVPKDFPLHIPAVFDTNDDVPSGFMHFLGDGSFCIGAHCDLRSFIEEHPSLTAFIDELLMSYLYSVSYFKLYGSMPFGERSHGAEGMKEAYRERYETGKDDQLLGHLLCMVVGAIPYRGHHHCPCGSGRILRNCHGPKVLRDIKSKYTEDYKIDAYYLLDEIIKDQQRKANR